MRRIAIYILMCFMYWCFAGYSHAQINTERVMNIGRNALQFEDYVVSIQYFNQVIKLKPYWADPYYYRAVAKYSLDDYRGADADATACIERNPFFNNVFYLRGVIRQSIGEYKLAIADYKQGLEYAPGDRNLLYNIALAYVQDSNYVAADSAFQTLFEYHKSYAPGYFTRGQYNLMRGDTLAAMSDLDYAITLDKNLSEAYAVRGVLRVERDEDYEGALTDLDEAIKLSPRRVPYYINRALVRYFSDDLRGAMSDYDYVLILDPNNVMTYYNRGLLRAQVGDRNRAVDDFTQVIEREPHNYMAVYNRAVLYDMLGSYNEAIADYDVVLEVYPEFIDGLYARSEARRKNGDIRGGEKDFMAALDLVERRRRDPDFVKETSQRAESVIDARRESDMNINKYDRLMIADENFSDAFETQYESKVRGRIQNRNVMVTLQPMFALNYYERPNELRPNNHFTDELDRLNELRAFKYLLLLTNEETVLEPMQVATHFASATNYTNEIDADSKNDILKYLGRSLDLMLLQDYAGALEDVNKVIALSPNFMLAYFQRAYLRYKNMEYNQSELNLDAESATSSQASSINISSSSPISIDATQISYELIVEDLNRAIELSPRFAYAYYNRGNIYFAQNKVENAISDYTEAIRLQPDFADAYFNRGLAYIKAGNTTAGRADLSKAGEMGVMAAYNILKRLDAE